jgi:hypothetical protein
MTQALLLPAPPVAGATHWTPAQHVTRIKDLTRGKGWCQGTGRYAILAFCNVLTMKCFADRARAEGALAWIDELACGHACQRWHALFDLETGRYLGLPLLERFVQQYPALVDVTSRDRTVVRRLDRGYRQVLFPGLARGRR